VKGLSSCETERSCQSQTIDLRCDARPEGAHFRR
jgi:hypothetical protein